VNNSNIYINVRIHIRIFILLNMKLLKIDYTINRFSDLMETNEMDKQWNIDDFDFHMDLMVGIFSLRLIGINIFHL
jgi:hypothetical protein